MAPNDQYLCIVPSRHAPAHKQTEHRFLPFEGDQTLAVILSKAFLLAEDHKITDSGIVNQIRSKGYSAASLKLDVVDLLPNLAGR